MIYFLDTEFNGFGGELMTLALVREDGESLYLKYEISFPVEDWVAQNVVPIIDVGEAPVSVSQEGGARAIESFLRGDDLPQIVTDWPDDVRHFCSAVIVGPGTMVGIPGIRFDVVRVDAYPTTLEDAVQHNALWDARALMHHMTVEALEIAEAWQGVDAI